jgi:hypothetical protein
MEFIRFYFGIGIICFALGSLFPGCLHDNLENRFNKDRTAMIKERSDFYKEVQSTLVKDPILARSILVDQMVEDAKDIEKCAKGKCSYQIWGDEIPFPEGSFYKTREWLAVMRNHEVLSFMPHGKIRLNWYGDGVKWRVENLIGQSHFFEYDGDNFKKVLALPPGEYTVSFLGSDDKAFYTKTVQIEENTETVIEPKVGVLRFSRPRDDLGTVRISHHGVTMHKEYNPDEIFLHPGNYQVESQDKKVIIEIIHGYTTVLKMEDGNTTLVKNGN